MARYRIHYSDTGRNPPCGTNKESFTTCLAANVTCALCLKALRREEAAVLSEFGLEIGQKIIVTRDIIEHACDDRPAFLYARQGEELIVRGAWTHTGEMPIRVSHEHITDKTFRVSINEIRA